MLLKRKRKVEAEKDAKFKEEVSLDKSKISTPLDVMYKMIEQMGRLEVSDAAKKFHVSQQQIEEWAQILESKGLIEIHYPIIGKPELRKK